MELGILRSRLPSVELVDSADSLTHYRLDLAILSKDSGERKDVFLDSLLKAMAYMPKTRSLVESMYKDAYLVSFEDIHYYIYEGLDGDDLFFYISGVPLDQDQSYGNVDVFYNYLDGFCDLNMQGGLLPKRLIKSLRSDGYFYQEEPSSSIVRTLSSDNKHIFNSGGKGQGYLDISTVHSDTPKANVLWLDDDGPMLNIDFWDLVDNWTEIAMQ